MAKVDEDVPIPKGVAFNGLEGENAEPVIFFQKRSKRTENENEPILVVTSQKKMSTNHWRESLSFLSNSGTHLKQGEEKILQK